MHVPPSTLPTVLLLLLLQFALPQTWCTTDPCRNMRRKGYVGEFVHVHLQVGGKTGLAARLAGS